MKDILLIMAIVLVVAFAHQVHAEDSHQAYIDIGWKHFSNVDAGLPFNHDHEDNMDHLGVAVEYQYHPFQDEDHFYASFGVGWTKANTKYQSGWDCSGCKLPSSLTFGYRKRFW